MNISSTTASSITNLIQQSAQTRKNNLTYNDLTNYSMAKSLSSSDYEKYVSLNSSSEVSSYTEQLGTVLSSIEKDTAADDASVLSSIISNSTTAALYTASGAAASVAGSTAVDIDA